MSYIAPSFMSFNDVISTASARMRDLSMAQFPPSVLMAYASEANRDFAMRSEIIRDTSDQVLVSGQRVYNLPTDCGRVLKIFAKVAGWTDFSELCVMREEDLLDGYSQNLSGVPSHWYLLKNRSQFGLFMVPSGGGFDGRTTGVGSTTSIVYSGGSTTANAYAGYTVRILDGALEGQSSVIVTSTATALTFSPALTGAPAAAVRFQIYPDSLKVSYIKRGNEYFWTPKTCTVSSAYSDPTVSTISTSSTLANLPRNGWVGCEIRFSSGGLDGFKSRVTASRSESGTKTEFTVFPEFPFAPAVSDQFTVTDVPNIPEDYHHYLPEYIIYNCLRRFNPAEADRARARYESGIKEAYGAREIQQSDAYLTTRLTMPANDQWYWNVKSW